MANVAIPVKFETLRDVIQHARNETTDKLEAIKFAETMILGDSDLYNMFVDRIVHLAVESEFHMMIQLERKRCLAKEPEPKEPKDPKNDGLMGFNAEESFPMEAIRHHAFLDYPLFDTTALGDANYEKVLKQRNIFRENRIGNQRSETVFTKIAKICKPTPEKPVRDCLNFQEIIKLRKEFLAK